MNTLPGDPLIGRSVGQYQILAKLGGGGMGVVYTARDAKLGRLVALKFLPPQWSHDEAAKQRFAREAQAASATNHRNICVIHDIDHTDDGQLFIVMAHYEGQTLKERLEAGPLPTPEAVDLAAEVAEGLAKAHAQGVVHRDIKPGNLMVTDDGVKILDFGLAKFFDSLQLTIPGSTIGTVAYMSPEQARGEEADARSDVWALGVVLFEMLTGEAPFRGAYPEAVFHAVKNEPVPPLRAADGPIPDALEGIVLKALEKDPARRFSSAREMARELRVLQGRSVPVDLRTEALPPLSSVPAGGASWRARLRRTMTPTHAVVVVAVLAASALGSYRWMIRSVPRITVAVVPVANHTGEPELDRFRLALTAALLNELGESPNIRVLPYLQLLEIIRPFMAGGSDMSSREAIQAVTSASGAGVIVITTLVERGGRWLAQVEFRKGDTGTNVAAYETDAETASVVADTAYRLIIAAAEGVQKQFKANGPGHSYPSRAAAARFRNLQAAGAFEQGLNAYERQEYAEAAGAFRQSISEDVQQPLSHAWLSRVLSLMQQDEEARTEGQRASQLVSAETPPGAVLFAKAAAAESQRDSRTAEERYGQLASLAPDDPWPRAERAGFLKRQQSRDKDAIEAYQELVRREPRAIWPHLELSQLYARNGEGPLAEEQAKIAVDAYRSANNRSGEALALLWLGEAERGQRGSRLAEARKNIEAGRQMLQSLAQPYGLARADLYLGRIAGAEGHYLEASQLFEKALSGSRVVGNRQLESLSSMNLGVVYQELGRVPDALKYYEQSRDLFQKIRDETRAAEQEVNIAALRIEYGSGAEDAKRRLPAARATLQKVGDINFDVLAMQVEAEALLFTGRVQAARKQLNEAITIAKERKLGRIVQLTVRLADSLVLMGEYDGARAQLEELRTTESARDDLEARVALARIDTKLGVFDRAADLLRSARSDAEATGQMRLAPVIEESFGELMYESGDIPEGRDRFSKAAAFWTDDLPGAASVEGRCRALSLRPAGATSEAVLRGIEAAIEQARKMKRVHLEAECTLRLADAWLARQEHAQAGKVLASALRLESPDSSLGPELLARLHFSRARALSATGDRAGAESDQTAGRQMMEQIQNRLSPDVRQTFASRLEIRRILEGVVR